MKGDGAKVMRRSRDNGTVLVRDVEVGPNNPTFIANVGSVATAIKGEKQGADIIEVRCDLIDSIDPKVIRDKMQSIRDSINVPILATIRMVEDGGNWYRFKGGDRERLSIFQEIMNVIDLVDIELDSEIRDDVLSEAKKYDVKTIVSYHDYFGTDDIEQLRDTIEQMYKTDGDIIKVAYFARDEQNTRSLLQVLLEYVNSGSEKPIVVISMGTEWFSQMTRVTFPLFGSCMTYGYVSEEEKAKVGQIPLQELIYEVKRYKEHFSSLPIHIKSKEDAKEFVQILQTF